MTSKENLWFAVACSCVITTVVMFIFTMTMIVICEDLRDVVRMKDGELEQLQAQVNVCRKG